MIKHVVLETLNTISTIIALVCMIYLFFLLPGCQFIHNHPQAVEEIEEVGEKILEFELSTVAKNSHLHASWEANHYVN